MEREDHLGQEVPVSMEYLFSQNDMRRPLQLHSLCTPLCSSPHHPPFLLKVQRQPPWPWLILASPSLEDTEEGGRQQGGQWFSGYSDLLFFHHQRSFLVRDDCGLRLVCWLPAHCWPALYSSTEENQKRLQPKHSRPVCTHTAGIFSGRFSVSLLLPLSSRTQAIDLSFKKKAVWIQRIPQTCSPRC